MLLGWDRETTMPPGGAEGRGAPDGHPGRPPPPRAGARGRWARSWSELAGRCGAGRGRPRDGAARAARPGPRGRACPRRWCGRSARPARAASARGSRRGARTTSPAYAGPLREVVRLKRQEAEAIGIGDEPYDALLDAFEPGARAAELEPVFADLRARLTPWCAGGHRSRPGGPARARLGRGRPDGAGPRDRATWWASSGRRGDREVRAPVHLLPPPR